MATGSGSSSHGEGRFSFPLNDSDRSSLGCRNGLHRFRSLGCRHGLVLVWDWTLYQVLVWDPFSGAQHRIALPPGFNANRVVINGAVLRGAGDVEHFLVVLVKVDHVDNIMHRFVFACVYSSETGAWGNLISTPIIKEDHMRVFPSMVSLDPAVLTGDSLYWILGTSTGASWIVDLDTERQIIEFDLERQSLGLIQVPVDMVEDDCFTIMRAEGGGLGFLLVSDFTGQLWKRKTDCDGVASWALEKAIELDKLLSLDLEEEDDIKILGYAEENNLVFLWWVHDVFMVDLESLQFTKLFEASIFSYHPFESVYTVETGVGDAHGVDLLHNA